MNAFVKWRRLLRKSGSCNMHILFLFSLFTVLKSYEHNIISYPVLNNGGIIMRINLYLHIKRNIFSSRLTKIVRTLEKKVHKCALFWLKIQFPKFCPDKNC